MTITVLEHSIGEVNNNQPALSSMLPSASETSKLHFPVWSQGGARNPIQPWEALVVLGTTAHLQI